jgi:hypothetical protein
VFHGERRFTEADYPRLDTRPFSQHQELCWGVSEGDGRGVTLAAVSRYGSMQAIQNRPGGRVRFTARAQNLLGAIKIARYVEAFGPASDFVLRSHGRSALVSPPAPFIGAATYADSRARRKWQGTLSVDSPGFPRYPLTGQPMLVFLEPGSCKVHVSRRLMPPPMCI